MFYKFDKLLQHGSDSTLMVLIHCPLAVSGDPHKSSMNFTEKVTKLNEESVFYRKKDRTLEPRAVPSSLLEDVRISCNVVL